MHKYVASWQNSQNSIRVPRGHFLQVPRASSQPYHAGQSWAKRLAGSLVVSTLHRGCVDETIEPMALVYHGLPLPIPHFGQSFLFSLVRSHFLSVEFNHHLGLSKNGVPHNIMVYLVFIISSLVQLHFWGIPTVWDKPDSSCWSITSHCIQS